MLPVHLPGRLLVSILLPFTKEKCTVALRIAFVTNDGKTTAERRFQSFPVVALQGERKISLLGILLPLVDGVRDSDAFEYFDWLGFTAQYILHACRAQPPFRI